MIPKIINLIAQYHVEIKSFYVKATILYNNHQWGNVGVPKCPLVIPSECVQHAICFMTCFADAKHLVL